MSIPSQDRSTLQRLAGRWLELAALPAMETRRRQWTALKDLHPERPLALFETGTLQDFLLPSELTCQAAETRALEARLRWQIRHVELVGDDTVLEPFLRLSIPIHHDGYGVPITETHAEDGQGGNTAYGYNHPVQTPADLARLRPRSFWADRQAAAGQASRWEDWLGGLLPVRVQGPGDHLAALTSDLFRLIGNDNLLTWPYDHPQALHDLLDYLAEDRLRYYCWLESENLLTLNNNAQTVGSGSPGFTTALPAAGYVGQARLRDVWVWMESQETSMISPRMFREVFLPSLARVAAPFGLVYYGCCEPVHDRWEAIFQALPHVRAVSVSPWCDMPRMGELLSGRVVFSRKPKPWLISGAQPDWPALEADLDATLQAAGSGPLEIIFRDVYRIAGDLPRLRRWMDLVRSRIGD